MIDPDVAAERRVNNDRMYQMVDDIHQAVFRGNGKPGLVTRVGVLEDRDVRQSSKVAAAWGGAGTAIGAALVAVLAYFGIRPQQ